MKNPSFPNPSWNPDRPSYNQRQNENLIPSRKGTGKKKKKTSFSDKRCEKIEKYYGLFFDIYRFCTSGAEDRSLLIGGSASASAKPIEMGFSERVSQLPQAAASSTPTGLGGGAGCALRSLRRAKGHVSIRYSSISWWQLLSISCPKKKQKEQKTPKKLKKYYTTFYASLLKVSNKTVNTLVLLKRKQLFIPQFLKNKEII